MLVPMTTCDFLERAALVYGDRVGIVDEPDQPAPTLGELSYRRVAELARSHAAALDGLGIGFGERVAIVSQNSARLLLALYGVAGSGRVLVPVNFRLSAAEIQYIVEHSGASLLLIDPELAEPLAAVQCRRRMILGEESDALLHHSRGAPVPWSRDENATGTINYTSGTTARPKGVQLTHRTLWVNALTFGLHAGVSDRDVYLHTLPTFHCNGWGLPFVLAGMGAQQIVLRKVQGAEILRRIERHGVTLLGGAPAVVNGVLDAARDWPGAIPGRGRVRMVVAGAPPPTRTIERVETELGWEFFQIYGLTETAPLLTVNRRRAEWDALGSSERAQRLSRAGSPAIGVQLRVDNQGEVLARSNVVLEGYWRQPEATAAAIDDGWFHTGDGGSIDSEGYLTITDRKKDMLLVHGMNVYPREIEEVLYTFPGVHEAAVIARPDEKRGEAPVAFVSPNEGATVHSAELLRHCRERLADYKIPREVRIVHKLPRTATGKVAKLELKKML